MGTRDRRTAERGAVTVVVAAALVALIAMLGLAMSVGHLLTTRGENQNAVDSSALAGAKQLNGRADGLGSARAGSESFALAHVTDSRPSEQVVASTVEFGHWYRETRQWELVTGRDAASLRRIQAVRVAAHAPQEVWFLPIVGTATSAQVGAGAIAVGGGLGEIASGDLPFVVRQGCTGNRCTRDTNEEYVDGYYFVTVNPTWSQSAGATSLDQNNPANTPVFCSLLRDGSGQLVVDQTIRTSNGTNVVRGGCGGGTTACDNLATRVGQTARIPIIQYPGEGDAACGAPYNGSAVIEGFMTVSIAFVECRGNRPNEAVIDPGLTTTDPTATANWFRTNCYSGYPTYRPNGGDYCIAVQVHCNVQDPGGGPGGGYFGTSAVVPRLVR